METVKSQPYLREICFAASPTRIGSRKRLTVVLFLSLVASALGAQTDVQLVPRESHSTNVAAGTSATLNFQVDTTSGADLLLVGLAPGLQVTLQTPSGTAVTAANAASQGYSWLQLDESQLSAATVPLPLTGASIQLQIGLPSTHSAGVYSLIIQNTATSGDPIPVLGSYNSSGPVHIALLSGAISATVGSRVPVTLAMYSGSTALSGATISAKLIRPISLTSQVSFGAWTRVNQISNADGTVDEAWTRAATLSGTWPGSVHARATLGSSQATLRKSYLIYSEPTSGNVLVPSGYIWTSRDSTASFDPSEIRLSAQTFGSPETLNFVDGSGLDAAAGDGLWTAEFAPQEPGKYTIQVTVTGTKSDGTAYVRNDSLTIDVTEKAGSITGVTDQLIRSGTDNKISKFVQLIAVNATSPGPLRVELTLKNSNGELIQAAGEGFANSAGTTQIEASLLSSELLSLQALGALTRQEARLFVADGKSWKLADVAINLGQTAVITAEDFDQGPVWFTRSISFQTIDQNGVPGFELLRFPLELSAPAGSCSVSGSLYTKDSDLIQEVTMPDQPVPGGKVILNLDFDGFKIAQSRKNGPYVLRWRRATCGDDEAADRVEFETPPLTSGQFEFVSPDFAFTLSPPRQSAQANSVVAITPKVTIAGGFTELIRFSATGLPAGFSLAIPDADPNNLFDNPGTITIGSNVAPGVYTIAVTATSASLLRNSSFQIEITTAPIAVTISSSSIYSPIPVYPSRTVALTATVTGTPNQSVVWSLESPIGTVSSTGVYTAPASTTSGSYVGVRATSVQDPTKSKVIAIYVLPPESMTTRPVAASLLEGQSVDVTGVPVYGFTGVNWTMSPAVGTLQSLTAFTSRYTAPPSISSSQIVTLTACHVIATNVCAATTITLLPSISVSVSPMMANVSGGGSLRFNAVVSNTANTAVQWSLFPNFGIVDTSGLYTAPASVSQPQTVQITATSVADPRRSASATIQILPAIQVVLFR